jgi:hypothetical protein
MDRFAEARRSRPRDLGRFLGDGTRSLDEVLRFTASSPEAIQELSRARVERIRKDREAERRRIEEAKR